MFISVAICTWNRAALLDLTLSAMQKLRIPDGVQWQLLVVNNNCTDGTDEVISRHAAVLPIVRLYEPVPGLAKARNCALLHATGDWLIWTDDDVLVEEDWLTGFLATATKFPDAAGIGGPVAPWFLVKPDPTLLQAFPPLQKGFCGIDHGPDERHLPDGAYVMGANMAFHRGRTAGLSFNLECGRVQNFQGGEEDMDFIRMVRAQGGCIVWSPGMRLRHCVDPKRMTIRYMDRWYTDLGEFTIRRRGVPVGKQWRGMPRWLIRQYITWLGAATVSRLTFRRVSYLKARQRCCELRGQLRGCRAKTASSGRQDYSGQRKQTHVNAADPSPV